MAVLDVVRKFFPNVTKVVDATRNATIEVTNKDASSKAVKDHKGCAMAVACKRKFHLDGVIISRSTAYLVKGKQARRFHVPESVAREVVSFDRGSGFAPGKYALQSISESAKLGKRAKRDGYVSGSHSTGKPKRSRHLTTRVRTVLGGKEPEE